MLTVEALALASERGFDEAGYLAANPDVAAAHAMGHVISGRLHFDAFGKVERRLMYRLTEMSRLREAKRARFEPLLDLSQRHELRGGKYDFLTPALRAETAISDTGNVSRNPYDEHVSALIERHRDGLVLDCGAGCRPVCYSNVVNLEIVDYPTTDVLAVGESIPFQDGVFDAVISVAVLEHVRDPFRCAAEIARVLKPGGELVCCVPFLQPEHAYPHHYYNMAPAGLRALFERMLVVDDQKVVQSTLPIWSLTWFIRSWADGLRGQAKEEFLAMSLRDLVADAPALLHKRWVTELPTRKNFELASATMLFAHKGS